MYIETSESFKKKTKSAIFSIVLFIITYILIFLLSLAFAVACIAAGVSLLFWKPAFYTFIACGGLCIVGGFVFYSVIKFIFKKQDNTPYNGVQINRKDQPKLFAMIDDIVKEVGTDSPQKVYITADINASVFYNSSFWSMFYPIRKNLSIGLGLINTTSEQELKAILAHEFGHFSQKSMKVGSYVYNVNKIIYNLVAEDEQFDQSVQSVSQTHGLIAIFLEIGLGIISGIQSILRKMYEFINIKYMALSREMEFHADEVAANVAGSAALETSLLRLSLANTAFDEVLNYYNYEAGENKISGNLYEEQTLVMAHLAEVTDIKYKNKLPEITLEESQSFVKSKLNIEDQWASHPTDEERISKLKKLNIVKDPSFNLANDIIINLEQLQKTLTKSIFTIAENDFETLETNDFINQYKDYHSKNTFSKLYHNYYDGKNPELLDLEKYIPENYTESIETLFSKEKEDLVQTLHNSQQDLKILENIAQRQIKVRTFDYDGTKYKQKDANKIINIVKKEIEKLEKQVLENDENIFRYFNTLDKKDNDFGLYAANYQKFIDFDKSYDEKILFSSELGEKLNFITETTPFETIKKNFKNLSEHLLKLKEELKEMLNNPYANDEISEKKRNEILNFINSEQVYFSNNEYLNEQLTDLFDAIQFHRGFLARLYFLKKLELLKYQETLYRKVILCNNEEIEQCALTL